MAVDHVERSPASPSQQLEILLADYQACREDERVQYATLAAVFGVFVTLIGLMAAAVTQTCEFSSSKSCIRAPGYILAASPLIPIALLAYATMLGVYGTLRSYYMRGLENEMRAHFSVPMSSLGDIMPASYIGISMEVVSLRRGRITYRLLANLVLAVVIVVFGGYTAYVGFHVGHAEQITMTITYSSIAILLVWQVVLGTIRGRPFFEEAAQNFLNGVGGELPKVRAGVVHQRSRHGLALISYLIFPRPEDWIKWLIAPGVFLAVAWSSDSFNHWPAFLALWLILEYLIYAARYQWNDVRGVEEDSLHSERRARRRLPVGPAKRTRRNVIISLMVAAGRIILALLLGQALGLGKPVLILLALVFGIAIVYEGLRAVKPSATPTRPTATVVAIWCLVGLGYGVRAGLGFIAGGLPTTGPLTWIGISCFIVFGIMFVLLTWVLAAASYCYIDNSGIWHMKPGVVLKAHLIALLRYVPISLAQNAETEPYAKALDSARYPYVMKADGGREKILIFRGQVRAPWNLALAVSAALAGPLGLGLAHATLSYGPEAIVISISLAAAGLLTACNSQQARLAITGIATVVLFGVTSWFGVWPYTLLAVAPWLAVALLYFFFRGSSYRDLKEFGPNLLSAISSVRVIFQLGPLLLRIVIGKRAWLAAGFDSDMPRKMSVDIYLDTDDPDTIERVTQCVDEFVAQIGYKGPLKSVFERGSFIRKSWAKVKVALTSDEVRDLMTKAERAVELYYLDASQAEVDNKIAETLSNLVASLSDVPNACIRAGSILLIKYTGAHGAVILGRNLSQQEVKALQKFPEIQQDPQKVLELLALAQADLS